MKIFIEAPGDNSVGIPTSYITIDEIPFDIEDSERGWVRESLQKLFSEILDDGRTFVVFEDEVEDGPEK